MDLNSLKDTVSNLTLYDLKAGVRKVQNAVMNYTEMEAKVREATNNEPWGASSSLMQEIANGTFHYQQLNEIMPLIYRRFTEKAAEEWRQIYKGLQLLEFLIKHGSERVIDDARSHLTLIKMLRQFHYIDQNGKDQGLNIRNRAKELADLLSDVERIRMERKKARTNKQKYTGVEGGSSFGGGSSSHYGGFGSEMGGGQADSYGAYSGGVYGDGGGFSSGGGPSSDFRDTSRRERFEEYDEFDEGDRPAAAAESSRTKRTGGERMGVKRTVGSEPPKEKKPTVDLFSFDEPAAPAAQPFPPSTGSNVAPTFGGAAEEDEFDDFQSATPSAQTSQPSFASPLAQLTATSTAPAAQFAAPKPVSGPQQANLANMVGLSSISPSNSSTATPTPNYSSLSSPLPPAAQPKPTGYQAATPNYFQSVQTGGSKGQANITSPGVSGSKPVQASSGAQPAAGGDAFGALWSQASVGIKKTDTPGSGVAMGQLAKEKSAAGIWGAPAASPAVQNNQRPAGSSSGTGGLGDLLG